MCIMLDSTDSDEQDKYNLCLHGADCLGWKQNIKQNII